MTPPHSTKQLRFGIAPTRIRGRDLAAEVISSIIARPGRAALTTLGTVLGVGTLIVILGLTSTAAGQVSARFDAQAATTIMVTDNRDAEDLQAPFPLSPDAAQRASQLNGVTGAGVIYTVRADDHVSSAVPGHTDPTLLPITAVSWSAWSAIEPTLAAGRLHDSFTENQPVAVLGPAAAARLGITGDGPSTTILIGPRPFTVIGVLTDVQRQPDLLLSVIVPAGTAQRTWGEPDVSQQAFMLIETVPGAAIQVADEAALAIAYHDQNDVKVSSPPDPRNLRDEISGDLTTLFYSLAGICLLIGTVGIANTTLVAVMERSGEIGLRRALGATARHIASQVVAESATLGILGGIIGTAAGLTAVIIISLLRGWSPIIDPRLLLLAPLIGLLTGAAAGLYPARKASRIEPTQALRGH